MATSFQTSIVYLKRTCFERDTIRCTKLMPKIGNIDFTINVHQHSQKFMNSRYSVKKYFEKINKFLRNKDRKKKRC